MSTKTTTATKIPLCFVPLKNTFHYKMMIIPLWKHKAENQLFLPWHSRTTDGHARKQMRSIVLLESSNSLEEIEKERERLRGFVHFFGNSIMSRIPSVPA